MTNLRDKAKLKKGGLRLKWKILALFSPVNILHIFWHTFSKTLEKYICVGKKKSKFALIAWQLITVTWRHLVLDSSITKDWLDHIISFEPEMAPLSLLYTHKDLTGFQ